MCSSTFGPAMLPSLLMWPTTKTVMDFSFAARMIRIVHSRTCEMLPGADSTLPEDVV